MIAAVGVLGTLVAFGALVAPSGPAVAQTEAVPETEVPETEVPETEAPETEAACLEAGGRWERGGIVGQLLCFLPTPDAGRACTVADDCSGFCLAETGVCSAETPLFGCFAIRDLDGAEVTLCID